MSSTEVGSEAARVLEEILGLIDEDRLKAAIDEPIDGACLAFHMDPPSGTLTTRKFHEAISTFLCHLYAHGLQFRRKLSLVQGKVEAISMIERTYENRYSRGYEAALIDATTAELDGISLVLSSLAEALKVLERQKYAKWVFAARLEVCDWRLKCEIAELLVERMRQFLPPEILEWPSARLVDELPSLIRTLSNARSMLQKILR